MVGPERIQECVHLCGRIAGRLHQKVRVRLAEECDGVPHHLGGHPKVTAKWLAG